MKYSAALLLSSILSVTFSTAAYAMTLRVDISSIENTNGNVGCALFRDTDEDFPMNFRNVPGQWFEAKTDGTVFCEFTDLQPGTYAVTVLHDSNENSRVDTNFFGVPTEEWGVSNNVRPSLRAPRFEEAQFNLNNDMTIEVTLDK